MSWVLAIAGFAMLVVLHEVGHFVAAKAVGMRVERFFLFFPPKVVELKRGETEYGIGAIPLGGFVKITGMNPDEELAPGGRAARLLPPAGLEADRRDRARARRSTSLIAFVILFFLAFDGERADATRSTSVAAEDARPPRCSARRPSSIAVDGERGRRSRARAVATRSRPHECAGEQTDGCRAATPAS